MVLVILVNPHPDLLRLLPGLQKIPHARDAIYRADLGDKIPRHIRGRVRIFPLSYGVDAFLRDYIPMSDSDKFTVNYFMHPKRMPSLPKYLKDVYFARMNPGILMKLVGIYFKSTCLTMHMMYRDDTQWEFECAFVTHPATYPRFIYHSLLFTDAMLEQTQIDPQSGKHVTHEVVLVDFGDAERVAGIAISHGYTMLSFERASTEKDRTYDALVFKKPIQGVDFWPTWQPFGPSEFTPSEICVGEQPLREQTVEAIQALLLDLKYPLTVVGPVIRQVDPVPRTYDYSWLHNIQLPPRRSLTLQVAQLDEGVAALLRHLQPRLLTLRIVSWVRMMASIGNVAACGDSLEQLWIKTMRFSTGTAPLIGFDRLSEIEGQLPKIKSVWMFQPNVQVKIPARNVFSRNKLFQRLFEFQVCQEGIVAFMGAEDVGGQPISPGDWKRYTIGWFSDIKNRIALLVPSVSSRHPGAEGLHRINHPLSAFLGDMLGPPGYEAPGLFDGGPDAEGGEGDDEEMMFM